jgi:hypothetical protein
MKYLIAFTMIACMVLGAISAANARTVQECKDKCYRKERFNYLACIKEWQCETNPNAPVRLTPAAARTQSWR